MRCGISAKGTPKARSSSSSSSLRRAHLDSWRRAASTVWEILKASGIDPGRRQTGLTWSQFLRSQAEAIVACDFFTVDLLDGTQSYVLAVIEHASRRIRILGITLHPTGEWTAQQARNLLIDLDERARRVKFMTRDRGS
jgi:putative transposase